MAINVVAEIELGDGSNFNIKDAAAHDQLDDHEARLLSAESKVNSMYENVNYLNQDAFSYLRVKKGSDSYDIITADAKKDIVTFIPGDNITLSADLDNDALTMSAVDTTYDIVSTTAPGLCPTRPGGTNVYLRGDGAWGSPANTTYNVVSKSAAGLAPQLPNETITTKYLRQDGSWTVPPNTTYSVVSKSANGLVPQLPNETSTSKYLRQDGTWTIPPNTTYSAATSAANGLMSSTDKAKLDGIESSANAYTHPTYTARTGQPTANASPAFGGTFTVSQISSDATGHVTAATNRTITIPSAVSTTSAAGLCPKLGGGTTNFLRADGTWAAPAQSAIPVVSKTAAGLAPQLPNETTTTKYLRQDGTWVTPPDTNTTYSAVTTTTNGLMTYGDKVKLNGIATGAEVNQNAFSNVKVGSSTVAADGKTDTLELVAGSNVTLTADTTNDKVTIAATNTTYSAATTSAAGLMSAADKTKLNGIAAGAQVNPGAATTSAAGLMSAADKTKLNKYESSFSDNLDTSTHTVNFSVGGSNYYSGSNTTSKSGYWPYSICGYELVGGEYPVLEKLWIASASNGSCKVEFRVCSDKPASMSLKYEILWAKL
ncbi:MAG: hypothetical protein J6Y02_15140 [Pseudobutyrivibrio sp.]|nr:hypothetical protein [Pseudobutyrivibrio sp.]